MSEPEARTCLDCSKPFHTAWAQRLCNPCRYERASRGTCAGYGRKTGQSGRTVCGECRYGPTPPILPMTATDIAWLAGIIEGEGTFGRKGHPAGQVRVQMTDEDVIDRLHSLTGVGAVHSRGKPAEHCRPVWEWSVIRRGNVLALHQLIAPLLLSRRRATVCSRLAAASLDMPTVAPPNPATPESWAWVAGLIEGEGWIGPAPASVRRAPVIGVESTDDDVIERLAVLTGVGTVIPIKSRNPGVWKTASRWTVRRRSDVRDVLNAILPLLGERRSARARYVLDAVTS
jgi:hypothetical protein